MPFGFYDPPKDGKPSGRYLYNARNLTKRGLFDLGTLTYHELVPGHHLHFALQLENASLHPQRSNAFINAFNEAWAEYAATLAGEIGMYEQPAERFGRAVMDNFLTARLVVDTGMNALGWSLQRARDYMREHALLSEAEISSETLRYACDIPAQSLAYKLGDTKLLQLRSQMAARAESRHDVDDAVRDSRLARELRSSLGAKLVVVERVGFGGRGRHAEKWRRKIKFVRRPAYPPHELTSSFKICSRTAGLSREDD